ncbi:MAG TPA: hypothetical protein VGM88_15520 [Kofleriaceae bacterium]|jgi:hypothetical protein
MAKHLRGTELVDAALAHKRAGGETLTGAADLDARSLGDVPLTPALRRWLEHDDEMFTLGEPMAFGALIAQEFGDEWADGFAELGALFTAPCVLFDGWGSDSRRFVYLGAKDEHGEYPVFTVDMDDGLYACLNGPVDVWLAQQAGYLAEEGVYGAVPADYEADRAAHAKLSFDGHVSWENFTFSDEAIAADE